MNTQQKAEKLALIQGLQKRAAKALAAHNCALVNHRISPSDENRSEVISTHQAWVAAQELVHTYWEWHSSQFR